MPTGILERVNDEVLRFVHGGIVSVSGNSDCGIKAIFRRGKPRSAGWWIAHLEQIAVPGIAALAGLCQNPERLELDV